MLLRIIVTKNKNSGDFFLQLLKNKMISLILNKWNFFQDQIWEKMNNLWKLFDKTFLKVSKTDKSLYIFQIYEWFKLTIVSIILRSIYICPDLILKHQESSFSTLNLHFLIFINRSVSSSFSKISFTCSQ